MSVVYSYFGYWPLLLVGALGAACSSNDRDESALSGQIAADDQQVSALTARVDQSESKLNGLAGKLRDLETAGTEVRANLQRTQDLADIAAVSGCYGRGHDAVIPGKNADQSIALAILQTCFADDVQSEFRYFGNPAEPADQLDGLSALAEYIGSFWANAGYHSARNVPGNVHVDFVDADHAQLLYSGTTPHFSLAQEDADPDPQIVSRAGFIDLISASYSSELARDGDGVWRTTHFSIGIKEVMRVPGTYWLAQ